MLERTDRLAAGARNLLRGAGGLTAGDRLLILSESPVHGYYGPGLAEAVADTAQRMALEVTRREVPFTPDVTEPDAATVGAMRAADVTLFLARLGDQIRFRGATAGITALVSYALDRPMLASAFGTLDHAAFVALRDRIDAALAAAGTIRITCPAGTDLAGRLDRAGPPPKDTTTRRFPMPVHTPVPAGGFRGVIAQRGFLVGTGSHYYRPYAVPVLDTLIVEVSGTRITGLSGPDAPAARAHYEDVAARYGIDPWVVHSWHGGLHPGCRFPGPAARNFERWSGAAFGNPRLLHFHTCGNYAPGEISLNLLDPTVTVDGVALWQDGRLHPDRVPGARAILDANPGIAAAFADPEQDCGAGPTGLGYRL